MSTSVPCPFEAAHGRPCLVCRGGGAVAFAGPDVSPTHPGHRALAEAADRLDVVQLYAERGLHLFYREVAALTATERQALDAWAATDAGVPGDIAMRAHRAGPVLAGVRPRQACTRCHLVLQDHAAMVEDGAYPVGAHVGLDCEGRPRPLEGEAK